MAKYTVELRNLVESGFDLGLTSYPIYDEAYRATLNQKIKDHFWFQEIGFDTPAHFKFVLNRTLSEIMPYYNQLYASAALTLNPLYNFDLTETTTRENTGISEASGSQTGSVTTESLQAQSDTPASLLSADNIKGDLYASNAARGETSDTSETDTSSLSRSTTLDSYARRVTGSQGVTQSAALLEFRQTFLNIDMQIIGELQSCFMGIW